MARAPAPRTAVQVRAVHRARPSTTQTLKRLPRYRTGGRGCRQGHRSLFPPFSRRGRTGHRRVCRCASPALAAFFPLFFSLLFFWDSAKALAPFCVLESNALPSAGAHGTMNIR